VTACNANALDALGRAIVERHGGRWTAAGGMCRCPAHDDRTPSLSVRPGDRRLLFHCFAGCDTAAVIGALRDRGLIDPERRRGGHSGHRPDRRRGSGHRAAAARLWADARPVQGSPAQAYLHARGLTLAAADLRYHPHTPYGRGDEVIFRPALLAAVRDEAGLVAVHRTFLDLRSKSIASLKLPKRALGALGTGGVRLFPPADGVLGWAEGIESAISATMLTGIPCWATLGNERFARVALPAGVERLILFLDADTGGRRAEQLARDTLRGTSVEIEARNPGRACADWNDLLLSAQRAVR
jgi:hypothetical protein